MHKFMCLWELQLHFRFLLPISFMLGIESAENKLCLSFYLFFPCRSILGRYGIRSGCFVNITVTCQLPWTFSEFDKLMIDLLFTI